MRAHSSLVAWRYTVLTGLGMLSACGEATSDKSPAASGGGAGAPLGSGGWGSGGEAIEHSGGAVTMPEASGGMAATTGGVTTEASGGAATTGGMTGGGSARCEGSKAITTQQGDPTGLESCSDGLIHRPEPMSCPDAWPRNDVTYGEPWSGECHRDLDCTARPLGYCEGQLGQEPQTRCNYGCTTDADCPSGTLCECGPRYGSCVAANCEKDSDCAGELRARNVDSSPCSDGGPGPAQFACTTPRDSCRTDADCATHRCAYDPAAGVRSCAPQRLCGIGRPFLVNGLSRTAPVRSDEGWLPTQKPASILNRSAAAYYQRAALLEHASIAAFARFTLELLALGAPADLVEAATQAMSDETAHARICFGLASRYAGRALGPGALPVSDALGSVDLARIVENVVLEGCIGESVAAEEAAQSLEFATDPEVHAALTLIARDERRHAELAYRFLDWALAQRPELAERVRQLLASESFALASGADVTDDALDSEAQLALAHGVFPDCWRAALRDSVLSEFVRPCVEALCGRAQARKPAPARAARHSARPS